MAIFTHSPKDSSHIKQFSYDDHSQVLSVTFAHKRLLEPKIYHHAGVPFEVFNSWRGWTSAGHSAGSYYHKFVSRYKAVDGPVLK